MQKRIRRRAVCEGGGMGRWIAAALILGLFVLAGWCWFGGQSSSRVRAAGMQKISVMVDRIDELSAAWKGRTPLDQNPGKGENDFKPESKHDNNVKPGAPAPAAPPAIGAPAAGPNNNPPPPAEPDVSKEDQEQLRKLLHKINKQ